MLSPIAYDDRSSTSSIKIQKSIDDVIAKKVFFIDIGLDNILAFGNTGNDGLHPLPVMVQAMASKSNSPNPKKRVKSSNNFQSPLSSPITSKRAPLTTYDDEENNNNNDINPPLSPIKTASSSTIKKATNSKTQTKEIAGFKSTSFTTMRNKARSILADQEKKEVLLSTPEFRIALENILKKSQVLQRDSCSISVDEFMTKDNFHENNDFAIECLALTLEFIKQTNDLNEEFERNRVNRETEFQNMIRESETLEKELRELAAKRIEKTIIAKERIKQKHDEVLHKIKSREIALQEKIKRQQVANEQRNKEKSMTGSEDAIRHQQKKSEIESERANDLLNTYNMHCDQYEILKEKRAKMLEEELQKLKETREKRQSLFSNIAAEKEREFKENTERIVKEKATKFQDRYINQILSQKEKARNLREKEDKLIFSAEQKKQLIENQRIAEANISKLAQIKNNAIYKVRDSLKVTRQAEFEDMKVQLYKGKSNILSESSPGPGAYNLDQPKKIMGGFMAKKVSGIRPLSTPGPGDYDLDGNVKAPVKGTIPFQSRGKTDVDWLEIAARKIPGVGSYNISSDNLTQDPINKLKLRYKALPFAGRGKTDLDLKISVAKGLPGVGYYELQPEPSPTAPSMTKMKKIFEQDISKTFNDKSFKFPSNILDLIRD